MTARTQLSPGGAIAVGLLMGAMGTLLILITLGAVGDRDLSDGTPAWVGVVAGLMFVMGGLAMIVGYGIAGGVAPDGSLPPGTPLTVCIVQNALGVGIAAMLALIGSWVAFGPGVRHFTGTAPFISGVVNEMLGRTVFGIGAVLIWIFVAAMIVQTVRQVRGRLRQA